ncbi:hypothetical protein [Pseudomonas nunensis]|uniref:Beta-lactamase enzyme family protein n=1 Tax=Pseudomonas nunensis TaxID=2961896 RepID=A0ABY5EKI3_9PSED|nr:hypothetical protein [Pseudomonas nunensis]KPN87452.1 hypothetical protein AL066_31545 [Pseudomonas nunensis]MCL5227292.1 hypothetical protein [Pseudomonas nunensis]UTO15821.1 hypothetical protein NK667_05560 [Pseudomonas nunensis]
MTDARPQLSKAELAHALRELKGFDADLETQSGYEASAALIAEIMSDPAQRDQLIALLEQFDELSSERSDVSWVNDGAPFDRSPRPLVLDDLYLDLPMGTEDSYQMPGSAVASVQHFLSKYKEEMSTSSDFSDVSPWITDDTCMASAESYSSACSDRRATYDVDAWSRVLVLANQTLQGEAARRAPFLSRLAQVFGRSEPPEWEVEKYPITRDSILVILHHGNDHASLGFIGNGQRAYVMVSINDTALTMNESFQNTQEFAARIADFFTEAPKSGHKAIQHMLKAL